MDTTPRQGETVIDLAQHLERQGVRNSLAVAKASFDALHNASRWDRYIRSSNRVALLSK